MSTPQSGITPEANTNALFLVLTLSSEQPDQVSQIRETCSVIPELTSTLSDRYPDARLSSTLSIGSNAWDVLYPDAKPALLKEFKPVTDGGRVAPATRGDLLVHIRSNRKDINFMLLQRIVHAFGNRVDVVEEVDGFRYLDSRDLTGFVDGTENPEGDDRAMIALVSEQSEFDGGSYIHTQRYVHKLNQWHGLPVDHQEQIIGRTKTDNIEFSSADKAPFAHVKRVNIKDKQGKGMEILRHSMPYGTSKEAGLFFISYGKTPLHFELMLKKMIKADRPGHHDQLLDYSDAVTGCAFFAPPIEFLISKR